MNNQIDLKSTSDGWRGRMAESFTFLFVEKLAAAIGTYILDASGKEAFIGYDTRFLSPAFAERAALVIQRLGLNVSLSSQPIPTPVVSFRTNQRDLVCGIMITASHNPFYYNGVKLRLGYGGPPTSELALIEYLFSQTFDAKYQEHTMLTVDNPLVDYVTKVRSMLDLDAFRTCRLNIVVDTMHGTTSGILSKILANTGCSVEEIHSDLDPYFGGVSPEPQMHTTKDLQQKVINSSRDLGFAHDGDGDRIIAVVPKVGYLSPHDVAVVLLWYLVKVRGEKGLVIGSTTMSKRLSLIASYFGLNYREVPIGFRNACAIMREEKVLLAGEENGGIGFGFYLPERDATVAAALMAEAEVVYRGGIRQILIEIDKLVGTSGFNRVNLSTIIAPRTIIERLRNHPPDKVNEQKVVSITEVDGLKLVLESGDWVNIRAAGTEELLRIYAESSDNNLATKLSYAAKEMIRTIEMSS